LSFAQPFAEAKAILNSIQHEKTDGHSGESSSPIRDGANGDGGVSEAHPSDYLMLRRTSEAHVAQKSIRRKYASTGSGGGNEGGGGTGHGSKRGK